MLNLKLRARKGLSPSSLTTKVIDVTSSNNSLMVSFSLIRQQELSKSSVHDVVELILINSGPLEQHYADAIMPNRLARLSRERKEELAALTQRLNDPNEEEKEAVLRRYAKIIFEADAYNSAPQKRNRCGRHNGNQL